MSKTNTVPCGACTLCCRGEAVILHPEDGDNPSLYKTKMIWHPFTNKAVYALERGPDGDACVYLSPLGGCTIWERRPAICRNFDCRRLAQKITRSQISKLAKVGRADMAVWDRGHELRHTIEDE